MSATWGVISPGQTGAYSYEFVGKVHWPQGTSRQLYASCSVQVG
jgi:hypothetical protein